MKNLFGEEVEPHELTFEFTSPHLTVLCNGKVFGIVSPNGWQGYTMNVNYKLGEPIVMNMREIMSLFEMQQIIAIYKQRMPDVMAMQFVINKLAEEKKLSFGEAVMYIRDNKIPCMIL